MQQAYLVSGEIELVTRVQIVDEAVCISLCTNTLKKGMNSSALLSAVGKLKGRLGSLALVKQPV